MSFKYIGDDGFSFILGFDVMTDSKGSFGVFLEIFRRRMEFTFRKRMH